MRKILIATLALLLLSGCGTRPLPSGMDEESVGLAGREIVDLLAAGDFQSVSDAFRDDLAEEYSVTAQAIEEVMQAVSSAGAYVQTQRTVCVGGKNNSFDEEYAIALVYCQHENDDVIYSVSLDRDLVLIGLEVKKS